MKKLKLILTLTLFLGYIITVTLLIGTVATLIG